MGKTLESDDELPQDYDDDDDDEDEKSATKGKKKTKKWKTKKPTKTVSDFDGGFVFDTDAATDATWHIDSSIKSRAKGTISSELMEDKIKQKRKERASKKKEADNEFEA